MLELAEVDPLIGTTVSHYRVDAYIGGGAMGRVYRGHHTLLQHKQVALKVLRGDLSATMAMRLRFTQEAESASHLVHPNVVSVGDFGRTETGLLYLAMDFVEGSSLAAIVEEGPLSAARTIYLAQQLCLGLGHAHAQGYVHRDFKPDNIIVVRDPPVAAGTRPTPIPRSSVPRPVVALLAPDEELERPCILDFGLAIHADPDLASARLTTAGAAVGTPVYAAPEQMQSLDEVDGRADLFALGVTMFEMLAGDIPFDVGLIETIHLNSTGERPAIATRARGAVTVPPRLERLVRRLMEPAPADRPGSAEEVYEELDAIATELVRGLASVEPRADVHIEPIVVPRKRRGGLVVAALIVATTAAIATVVATRESDEPVRVAAPVVRDAAAQPAPPIAIPPPVAPPVAPPIQRVTPPPARSGSRAHGKKTIARAKPIDVAIVTGSAAPAPVVEPAPIVVEPAPVTPPIAPAPVVPPPPRPVATSARLAIENLSVRGALTVAQVKRALDRVTPSLRACYGPAAAQAKSSPGVAIQVRFELDESQRARSIQATGATLAGLAPCVQHALADVRAEQPPDVGSVDVTFVAHFTPEAP